MVKVREINSPEESNEVLCKNPVLLRKEMEGYKLHCGPDLPLIQSTINKFVVSCLNSFRNIVCF